MTHTVTSLLDRCTPEPNCGCYLWLNGLGTGGYARISKDGRAQRVTRVLYEMLHGPIPDRMWVLHRCDVRSCCNPAHLFLGTPQDNAIDMTKKGRQAVAILTVETVRQARRMHAEGQSIRWLASRFKTANKTMAAAIRGKTWAHV